MMIRNATLVTLILLTCLCSRIVSGQDRDNAATWYQRAFEKMDRISDGEWTLVESGIRPGERVVTLGAYQIKLSSLNTSELSDHGHVH